MHTQKLLSKLSLSVLQLWSQSSTSKLIVWTTLLLSLTVSIIACLPNAEWVFLSVFLTLTLVSGLVTNSQTVQQFRCEHCMFQLLPKSIHHTASTPTMCHALLVDQYRRAHQSNDTFLQGFFNAQPTFHEIVETTEFPEIPTLSGIDIVLLTNWYKILSKSNYADIFAHKYPCTASNKD